MYPLPKDLSLSDVSRKRFDMSHYSVALRSGSTRECFIKQKFTRTITVIQCKLAFTNVYQKLNIISETTSQQTEGSEVKSSKLE